jgi:formate dehydrogenase
MNNPMIAPSSEKRIDITRITKRRKKDRIKPKGRQADEISISEIKNLINTQYLDRRDLLIENLHMIQDEFGCLRDRHLVALAKLSNLPMAEVTEVASFYHHFDILKDEQDCWDFTVRICEGISCEMGGANKLFSKMKSYVSKSVRVIKAPCVGRCEQAPVAVVHQNPIPFADKEKVVKAVEEKSLFHKEPLKIKHSREKTFVPTDFVEASLPSLPKDSPLSIPTVVNFEQYVENGGYEVARKVYQEEILADNIIATLEDSGLRGLGGAGFPVGRKWKIVKEQAGEKLMALNLDEGEPGTFKDRTYLERDPHRFLEGMLIAGYVVGIKKCYIYLRDEYHGCRNILEKAVKELTGGLDIELPQIEVRRGAGAYICGEESAMIESIEGKRGEPRMRPPYIAQVGLFGLPTLEHNFESLYWIRDIITRGADWFASFGRNGRKGLRSFSVSGRVKYPGVKLAPAGISIRELIDEYCGGMMDGHSFYGYLPGGASGGILPATMDNIPLDFDTLQEYGCFIGSAAIVVFSGHDKARDVAFNIMKFFEHESCGQCTPCRVGTSKAGKLMGEKKWNSSLLGDLKQVMTDASICGLGQAAANPINCVQKYFPEEVS